MSHLDSIKKTNPFFSIPKFCSACGSSLMSKYVAEEFCDRLVCSQCDKISYLNPQVVAGAILTKDEKIILLRRGITPAKGLWTYPAGFVELGESVVTGAVRETKEEIGLDVQPLHLLGVYSYPNHSVVTVVYITAITGGKVTTTPEADEIGEFSPAQIPWKELAFESTTDAIKDWIEFTQLTRR